MMEIERLTRNLKRAEAIAGDSFVRRAYARKLRIDLELLTGRQLQLFAR